MNDRQLVIKFQNGEKEAFDQLVKKHYEQTQNLFIRLAGNSMDANDLCQETFIRVYHSLKKFKSESEERALGEKISHCLEEAYANEPFVRLLPAGVLPDTKNVTHTNYLDLAWRLDRRTGRLIVMSAIDNLVKGASGQAVQNMNAAYKLKESMGLR